MDWLLDMFRQRQQPMEYQAGRWNTNDQIPRGKNNYTYSDTPYLSDTKRMPEWTMMGNTQWGTASLPYEPTEYESHGLLNRLLSHKPGTFQERMDVERMLLDDKLRQWLMYRQQRPTTIGM